MINFNKYPKTNHLIGSKFLDESHFLFNFTDNQQSQFKPLSKNQFYVIEEKMDGIGIGIFFNNGIPFIQHRNHFYELNNLPQLLSGFKLWFDYHKDLIYSIILNDYVLFGEWLEFKHSVFYNNLPSYFLEYDIYDIKNNMFLSTIERDNLIQKRLFSVKVLHICDSLNLKSIHELLKTFNTSFFNNSNWEYDFNNYSNLYKSFYSSTVKNANIEGFYIKIEDNVKVNDRYKWIRKEFFDILLNSNHWKDNQLIKNKLFYYNT